jgi:hypothetical protein
VVAAHDQGVPRVAVVRDQAALLGDVARVQDLGDPWGAQRTERDDTLETAMPKPGVATARAHGSRALEDGWDLHRGMGVGAVRSVPQFLPVAAR